MNKIDMKEFDLKAEDAEKQLNRMTTKKAQSQQDYLIGYYEAVIDICNLAKSLVH